MGNWYRRLVKVERIAISSGIAMIPDSAIAIDRKRKAESFRSEGDGFLPLSRDRSAVLGGMFKSHRNDVRERKITLKLHSRTPSLLQDSTSLAAFLVRFRNPDDGSLRITESSEPNITLMDPPAPGFLLMGRSC